MTQSNPPRPSDPRTSSTSTESAKETAPAAPVEAAVAPRSAPVPVPSVQENKDDEVPVVAGPGLAPVSERPEYQDPAVLGLHKAGEALPAEVSSQDQ